MGNLISGSGKSGGSRAKITDADKAVLSLKSQRRKLEDQSKLLDQRIEQSLMVAREMVGQQQRDRALLALKKKRLHERQLAQIHTYLLHVEDMLANFEVTKQTAKVMAVLKEGNEALKASQQQLTLEDVQQILDDTAEAREHQERMQHMLQEQLSDVDMDLVAAEFSALSSQVQAEDAAEVAAQLPEVPKTQVPQRDKPGQVAQDEEDAEVGRERQLEAPLPA